MFLKGSLSCPEGVGEGPDPPDIRTSSSISNIITISYEEYYAVEILLENQQQLQLTGICKFFLPRQFECGAFGVFLDRVGRMEGLVLGLSCYACYDIDITKARNKRPKR